MSIEKVGKSGVFFLIYCFHGHQKDYELALPYLEEIINEAARGKRAVLLLLEQAGPPLSIEEIRKDITTTFRSHLSTTELLWDEKHINGALKKVFKINQDRVIKEVEARGVSVLTNIRAKPLIEFISRHGLEIKLEESPFEAWLYYQRELESVKSGITLFVRGDDEGSLEWLEKSVEYYLKALKTRDDAFMEFIDGLFTRFPAAYLITLRGPLHFGIHRELEKLGTMTRAITVEKFTADTFSPFERLVSRLYRGEQIPSSERRELLKREYIFELLMSLLEKIEVTSSLKAKLVNQVVKRIDEKERKELLAFLSLLTSAGIFCFPEDPANAVYDWLVEKGKLDEEERRWFILTSLYN